MREKLGRLCGGLVLAASACTPADTVAGASDFVKSASATITHASIATKPVRAMTSDSLPPPLRYNEVQQKATHNSFDRDEPIFDQIVYDDVRSVELDIHEGKRTFEPKARDWFVYHIDVPGLDRTSCTRLSDCLAEIRTAHDARPEHEVFTVFIDLKDEFHDGGHSAADLDAALSSAFDAKTIWKPSDALARCPRAHSIRDALSIACTWPTLSELRGKIVFATTGSSACKPNGVVAQYAKSEDEAESRVAFVAPDVDARTCPFSAYGDKPYAAFFNLDYASLAFAPAVYDAGLVSRAYFGGVFGGLDTPDAWQEATDARVHFLATDRVNEEQDPWARTRSDRGWPFRPFDTKVDVSRAVEPGSIVELDVRSGDIYGDRDGFYFLYDDAAHAENGTWSAFVSTPSSHVAPWAKGCLMARATEEASSPYFAVCRPADRHGARVQYRLGATDASTVVEANSNAEAFNAESVFYLRLSVREAGSSSADAIVAGEGSFDGVSWFKIHEQRFGMRLPYQGLAASGHDPKARVRFLFGDVRHTAQGEIAMRDATTFPRERRIGDCPEGATIDVVH